MPTKNGSHGLEAHLKDLYSLEGSVAIVTGGTGVLGSVMAKALGRAGARVGVLGRDRRRLDGVVTELEAAGGEAVALQADVLRTDLLEVARDTVMARWGGIDILVNAAGGNVPTATLSDEETIFGLAKDAFEEVFELNFMGTLLSSQVFGAAMVRGWTKEQTHPRQRCIVNVSSMAAQRSISRVPGYSAAKAAVENLTRWMASDLARRYQGAIRVNAIAPGFFLGKQNRDLLIGPNGSLTERGHAIVAHTPAGRFGRPDELVGTLVWLCSPSASFVNGIVVPVDGGFSTYGGV